MKSAYELALERLETQGIRRPDEAVMNEATRSKIAELRNQAEAKLAEMEILHQDRMGKLGDPHAQDVEQLDYVRERRRIEEACDYKVEQLRSKT